MHVREVLSRGTNKESLKVMVEKCRSEDKGKFKGGSAVANAVERREGGGGGRLNREFAVSILFSLLS